MRDGMLRCRFDTTGSGTLSKVDFVEGWLKLGRSKGAHLLKRIKAIVSTEQFVV